MHHLNPLQIKIKFTKQLNVERYNNIQNQFENSNNLISH